MELVTEAAATVGVVAACAALGVPRASYYRAQRPTPATRATPRSPRRLSEGERAAVLAVLHEPRFADQAPAEVYASLLDEGRYLCSLRTFYRILAEHQEVRERRAQLRHPAYTRPELLAEKPNTLWSWDITKLLGPAKWTYFHLYVVLDVFSRFVVGWMVAHRESSTLAEKLLRECYQREHVKPGALTVHADRGTSMTSKTVALLLSDLGVTKSHSRPHVSDDNPFSEAQFKTLKYRPDFPQRFGSLADARSFLGQFFRWYNEEHHHGALGLLTPSQVHHGEGARVRARRAAVLAAAQQAHPERFVRGTPIPPALPTAVWINPPKETSTKVPAAAAGNADEARGNGGAAPSSTHNEVAH